MEKEQIRKKLHDYIDAVDDSVAEAIYVILQKNIEGDNYSEDMIAEFHKRRSNYHHETSESFSVEESLHLIRKGK